MRELYDAYAADNTGTLTVTTTKGVSVLPARINRVYAIIRTNTDDCIVNIHLGSEKNVAVSGLMLRYYGDAVVLGGDYWWSGEVWAKAAAGGALTTAYLTVTEVCWRR